MNGAPFRLPHELDASFRLFSYYHVGSDTIQTRFDVLLGSEKGVNQFSFEITSGNPLESPLHLDNAKGLLDSFDVRVSSGDLIRTFRAFADRLERHHAKSEPAALPQFAITEPEWNTAIKAESEQDRMWRAVCSMASS